MISLVRCIFDDLYNYNTNKTIMNLLKKFRLFPLLVFVFSILFAGAVTSCAQKSEADDKEGTEHPAAEDEKASEHPEGAAENEHPAETDTTKTEQQ